MAIQHVFGLATNTSNAPISNAQVTVYQAGTLTTISIWSDALGTVALVNPFTVNADGTWAFYCTDGQKIRIRLTAPGANTRDIDNINVPSFTTPQACFRPEGAALPNSAFPTITKSVGANWTDYTLAYDSGVLQTAFWYWSIPSGVSFTGAEVELYYRLVTASNASVPTPTVTWTISSRAIVSGSSFDGAPVTQNFPVDSIPASPQTENVVTLATLSNASTWTSPCRLEFAISRQTGGATVSANLSSWSVKLF